MDRQDVRTLARVDVDGIGRVRVELWPEGLVLKVAGSIRWKSWGSDTTPDDLAAVNMALVSRARAAEAHAAADRQTLDELCRVLSMPVSRARTTYTVHLPDECDRVMWHGTCIPLNTPGAA